MDYNGLSGRIIMDCEWVDYTCINIERVSLPIFKVIAAHSFAIIVKTHNRNPSYDTYCIPRST